MDVYLVRHAIADDRHPERYPDDSLRPLTDVGIVKFGGVARGLGRIVPEVDVVLASPYVRAWSTAVLLHDEIGWPEPVECPEIEAVKSPSGALAILDAHAERGSVALVGHEPFLTMLASLLVCGDEDALRMELKKGGVIALAVSGGRGTIRWSATPKLLRALDS
jgi:phosphohistidine phosphatase